MKAFDVERSAPAETMAFGCYEVVPQRRELLAEGQPIKLGRRAFDMLMGLIEARGSVVSKDDLMARVWPGQIVEENNIEVQVSALRTAFGPSRHLIRTVFGRGYQFTGDIRPIAASPADERHRRLDRNSAAIDIAADEPARTVVRTDRPG